jgi:DNA polymerase III sliding clamp (beta) subunit (PCNA family)
VSEAWDGYPSLEFRVRKGVLAQLIEYALAAIPSRESALVVHGCFQVTVQPGWLQLTATNTMLTVFAGSKAADSDGSGVVYLPARRLKEIVAAAPDGDIIVAVRRDTAVVTAGPVHWDVKMPPSPRGYSELPDLAAISFAPVPGEPLLTALKTVRHAVCKDSGRPSMHQVRVAKNGDGMLAAAHDSSQTSCAPVPGFPFGTTIPAAMLDELISLLAKNDEAPAEAGETDGTLAVRAGHIVLACQRMATDFPNLEEKVLIPTSGYPHELAVDRAELLRAVKRVSISANQDTSALALIAEGGQLTVVTRDDGGNRGEEQVQLARPWPGTKRVVAVNWRHLADMAAVCPAATLVLRLGDDTPRAPSMLRLEDPASGVIGVIPQMKSSSVGF